MKRLYLIVIVVFTLAACNLGRGFKPPSNENENWTSRNTTSQLVINKAMLDCGFTVLEYGYGVDNGDNADATRQECMFANGFFRKSGSGGICSLPRFRETLPACASATIRSRSSYYGK